MASNIEIKARIRDWAQFKRRAEELSDTPVEVIRQEDVFFHTSQGRLKLRILSPASGQLVWYSRPDAIGPKRSDYLICATGEPDSMKNLLARALDVRGVVRKTRYLYLIGQTRLHMDEVEGLGTFAELEVVLRPGQSDADGFAVADALMRKLEICAEDLVEGAYMDLLEGYSAGQNLELKSLF
jgi:predicted adenylyl cyclase CyaB